MQVPFGVTAYDLNEYGLPTVELENWFPEAMPHLGQARLVPTPGLVSAALESNRVRGGFWSEGLIAQQLVYATGSRLRRLSVDGRTTDIGPLPGLNGYVNFAASQSHLVALSGGVPSIVTGKAVTNFALPGTSAKVASIAELGQRHLFVEEGSGRFWWSAPGNPSDISAVNFATAESEPDTLRAIVAHFGSVVLLGAQSLEFWAPTGDQDRAFVARPGAVIPMGVIGSNAVCATDNALFLVNTLGQVIRLDGFQPSRVSASPLERRIKSLSAENQAKVRVARWAFGGHEFVRVSLPGVGAWNYDLTTGAWHRARSLNVDTHIVDSFVEAFGSVYGLGDGGVYELSGESYRENGDYVRRVAEALIPVPDNRPTISRLTVQTSTAGVPASGQGAEPLATLAIARNGSTFSNEVQRALPKAGEYAAPVSWGPLGAMRPPVAKARLVVSDPVGTSLSDAKLNMARP